jgi:hypothetical protein
MAPSPAGTACCMYCPRACTARTASSKLSTPEATSAAYSPSECPATQAGTQPRERSTRSAATETVTMAGCVYSVVRSWSSGPSKMMVDNANPSASSASVKVARASAKLS